MNQQPMPMICKNCGRISNNHSWVSRKCPNRETYEELIPLDKYIELQERQREAVPSGREAVENILSWRNPQFEQYGHEWDCHKDDAIAAIDKIAEEVGK